MDDFSIIIQARMGSSRRPGKINYLFDNEPMLIYQINRLKAFGLHNIIVATSTEKKDDITQEMTESCGVRCFRGSEEDVLSRFYECAEKFQSNYIVRVGGDDPLIDPEGIKLLIKKHSENPTYDLMYTSHPDGWIYGTAAELFTFQSLKYVYENAKSNFDREHVVPYFKTDEILKSFPVIAPRSVRRKDIYVSVDYQEDLDLITQIISFFTQKNKRYSFMQQELIDLFDSEYLKINNKHLHNGF